MASELNQNSLNTLRKHLEAGEFANAEDMNVLKKLIDYEVNWRRHQNYSLTTEIAQPNKQFDTAKYINNLIGGLRKIHKQKFQLVTQNITFINAIFDIVRKLEVLMSYKEYTPYSDNAGCDGECRGLCSSCSYTCTGNNQCSFAQYAGSGSNSYIQEYSSGGCSNNCTSKFSCTTQSSSCPHNCPGYDGKTGYVYVHRGGSPTSFALDGLKDSTGGDLYERSLYVGDDGVIRSSFSPSLAKMLVNADKLPSSVRDMVVGKAQASLTRTYDGDVCSSVSVHNGVVWDSSKYNGGCGAKNYSH